jgi:hypothetical protein
MGSYVIDLLCGLGCVVCRVVKQPNESAVTTTNKQEASEDDEEHDCDCDFH